MSQNAKRAVLFLMPFLLFLVFFVGRHYLSTDWLAVLLGLCMAINIGVSTLLFR